MNKSQFGVVAYDMQSKSSKKYILALNQQYRADDFEFVRAWDNVDSLMDFTMRDGVPVINELSKILILDSGFNNQEAADDIVENFMSLQETFNNRGINRPYLLYATSNNRVFDIFKTKSTYHGHDTISYDKTRIFSLTRDSNGSLSSHQLENILLGLLDNTAVSIRHDYQDRGDLLQKNFEHTKQSVSNQHITDINAIREQLKHNAHENNIDTGKKTVEELRQEEQDKAYEAHDRTRPQTAVEKVASQVTNNLDNADNNLSPQFQTSNNSSVPVNDNKKITVVDYLKAYQKMPKTALSFSSKLASETGTILFSGRFGSGVTSTIYNIASMYQSYNRHVLIINLDLYDDLIHYYPTFINFYNQKNLQNVFSSHFITVDSICVDIDNNLSIISDYGNMQREQSITDKVRNLKRLVEVAQHNYEIILIDAGPYFNEAYGNISELLDDIIFVSKLDVLPSLDNFSTNRERLNTNVLHYIINHQDKMPGLIISCLDFQANNSEIRKQIKQLNTSLCNCRLISAVMYDKYWDLQLLSQTPYCLQNRINFQQIQYLTQGLIV